MSAFNRDTKEDKAPRDSSIDEIACLKAATDYQAWQKLKAKYGNTPT
jgi:hypothetical protein